MTAGARRGEAPIGEVFHGTTGSFDALDPRATPDDGVHFGSLAQARARAGPRGRVIAARLSVERVLRMKDAGGVWRRKVLDARRRGYDAIVCHGLFRWCEGANDPGLNPEVKRPHGEDRQRPLRTLQTWTPSS